MIILFIFSTMQNRLNYHIHKNNIVHTSQSLNKKGKIIQNFFTILYVNVGFWKLSIALKMNSKLVYSIFNTLKN